VSRRPAAESERIVATMTAAMCHEPFYETGAYSAPQLGIYAGWVAHPGSYAARYSGKPRGNVVAVLAGECLDDAGETDVIERYLENPDFVQGLNGLFSGLVVDADQQRALLFNDRYGIERLYYHQSNDEMYFASEAKALLSVLPHVRALDPQAVTQLLAFGCTLDWQTLFQGIELLQGGTLWSVLGGNSNKQTYFTPSSWESQGRLDADGFDRAFQETFKRILPRYVGGGHDVGISLTGGLDTRMIAACLPDSTRKPVTYTFSGQHDRTLDERLASKVATTCKLDHRVLRIGSEFLTDYAAHVDRTVLASDGVFGATGAHEVYLNRQARALAPIRLTGNFGSEVLRSMSTFKPLRLRPEMFEPSVANEIHALSSRLQAHRDHPVTFAAFREIPWSLFGSLAAGRSQLTFRTPYLDNDLVALAFRAPERARLSPSSALRLVNANNAELGKLPTDRGVLLNDREPARSLRRLFSEVTFKLDYLHKEGLPDWLAPFDPLLGSLSATGVLGLHKYLPYRRWFRGELASHVRNVLTDPRTARLPYWTAASIGAVADDHIAGRRNYVREINAVLTLEAIDRVLVRGYR
jgi:asparagine synthase (glutamine-hydrolysing)